MKLSNQLIVDVPRPWLWTVNGLAFAPLLTARLWFSPQMLEGVPQALRGWAVIGPWMILGLIAHNLLRRWAAARGAPVVRIGELVVRHGRWLGELPFFPAILLGLGAGVAFAVFGWLALPIITPPEFAAEPIPWGFAVMPMVMGLALVYGRRHVIRLYLADNTAALAEPEDRESPATADIGWPAPPWRLYGAWAVLYGLATAVVFLTPAQADLAWILKLAPYPLAWIAGLVFYLVKPRAGPSWRVYTLWGAGRAVAFGALYFGAPIGVLLAPLGLVVDIFRPQAELFGLVLPPLLALFGGVAYGAILGLFIWAMNATDLWVPKAVRKR